MQELIKQYHLVASFEASCRMNTDQRKEYEKLNVLFNELSGRRAKYSVCNRNSFLQRVKSFIDVTVNN